jgi:hypothetical protein
MRLRNRQVYFLLSILVFSLLPLCFFRNVSKGDVALASSGLIMTSYFTYADDPQRKKRVTPAFDYMANFWNSVIFHDLSSLIFHDNISDSFVEEFSSRKIHFHRVNPHMTWSTNDYRFKVYNHLLKTTSYTYFLFCDISDVFFNSDPFLHMMAYPQRSLFLSYDLGKFHKAAWRVKDCYNQTGESWNQSKPMYNAGAWGGKSDMVSCILQCIDKELSILLQNGREAYNCNMPVFNWCVHFSGCSSQDSVDHSNFANPFRQECYEPHPVIHNKCKGTEGKICLESDSNGRLIMRDLKSNCLQVPRHSITT